MSIFSRIFKKKNMYWDEEFSLGHWNHIAQRIYDEKELANTWYEDVQNDFKAIKKGSKEIIHILKKLKDRFGADPEYQEELKNLTILIHLVKHPKASESFLNEVYDKLRKVMSYIEKYRKGKVIESPGRRLAIKRLAGTAAAAAAPVILPKFLYAQSNTYDLIFGSYSSLNEAQRRLNELKTNMPVESKSIRILKMIVENEIRFRVWLYVGKDLENTKKLEGYFKTKYKLTEKDIAIIPQVEFTYHIQLSANLNPLWATLFLKELYEEGIEKKDILLINSYILETERDGRNWYIVLLPTEFQRSPEPQLVQAIVNKYQVIRDYKIGDAFPIPSELIRDTKTSVSKYKEVMKKEEKKIQEKVRTEAKKQVQDKIKKIEQAPLTWDGDIKSLMSPAVIHIRREYKIFSRGKELLEETARQFLSWLAKYTNIYDVDFLDILGILVHENRFVNKTGDIANKILGTNIANPSEGFIQMGQTTQITVYNCMIVDNKKNPTKYPLPKATRKIKDEWKSIYDYYKKEKIPIADYIPDIRNNAEYQIWFASRFFKFCKGDVGKYNAGKYSNKAYEERVKKEQQEILRLKQEFYNQ